MSPPTTLAQQVYSPFVRRVVRAFPPLRWVAWSLEAAALALFWGVLSLLSPERASAIGSRLLRRVGPGLKKHRHVRRNLEIALPERRPEEIEAIARDVWGSLGSVMGEFPHLGHIAREVDQRVELVHGERLDELLRAGRPVVFVTPHLGNWEIATLVAARRGIPLAVVYTSDSNPLIAWLVERRRQVLGCELVRGEGGARALMRTLKNGRSVGLVVDARRDDGQPIPFLGVEALTTLAPARLALRLGLAVVPLRVERLPDVHFRIEVGEPLRGETGEARDVEQARELTQRINAVFAGWIRETPGQWMCTKRRWPKDATPPRPPPPLSGNPSVAA